MQADLGDQCKGRLMSTFFLGGVGELGKFINKLCSVLATSVFTITHLAPPPSSLFLACLTMACIDLTFDTV